MQPDRRKPIRPLSLRQFMALFDGDFAFFDHAIPQTGLLLNEPLGLLW
jgi:hypothetical protein